MIGLVVAMGCGSGNKQQPADAHQQDDGSIVPDAPIDAAVAPVFRNAVTMPDDQLATQALQILGANVAGHNTSSCNSCHGMTKQHIAYWRALGDTAMSSCLTDLAPTTQAGALAIVNCLRLAPTDPSSQFAPQKLGIYASASRLPWFNYVFDLAYGAGDPTQKNNFIAQAGMPHNSLIQPLTQQQFDIVAEWFVRGLPLLDTDLPQDPAPTDCTAGISSDVSTHTALLKTTGWRSLNKMSNMSMFDCGAATDPKDCLQNHALASGTTYGATWDVAGKGHVRILDELTYRTSYWTRSSPDGRFVGHGVSSGGTTSANIIDLQRDRANVWVAATYDPGFFPDNSGFVFQNGGTPHVCPNTILTTGAPTQLTLTETGCTVQGSIGLYQHVGKALNNGDYFTINGQFVSDTGGHSLTNTQPEAFFDSNSEAEFNTFIFDGTSYVHGQDIIVQQAYEGDSVMSPSATLEISRLANSQSTQLGYVLRKVNATYNSGTATYSIATPEIARYCVSGGKPNFSYDERWIVYHHYIENTDADAKDLGFTARTDAGFLPYAQKGGANVYLMDLATGITQRITNMSPGQYAVMPHFRSDGWIYFNERDTNTGAKEHIAASDAALILE
ncbi:MAG: hypothetical protein QM831_07025 [Kofleriaceae bacterium]